MSYGPAPRTRTGGGLIAVGCLALLQLLIQLAILGFDLSEQGVDYLPTALGLSYTHFVPAPVGFFGYDAALSVALLALAIGAFSGGRWVRPAAVALLATNAYSAAAVMLNQLFDSDLRRGFAEPFSHLLLNLTQVAAILIALAVTVVVAVTRKPSAPAAVFTPSFPPAPGRSANPPFPPAPAHPVAPPAYPSAPPGPSGPPAV